MAMVLPKATPPASKGLAAIVEAVEADFDANDALQIRFATADFPLSKVFLYDTN
jgi:hypothetical protein